MTTESLFPYKVAAIDLDDTLLGHDKQVSAANLDALRRLQAHGVHIVLASGRRHENMLRYHRELELEGPIISCQGALVRNAETGEILHRHLMEARDAAAVIKQGVSLDMTQMYYHLEATYTRASTPYAALYESRTGSTTTKIGDMEQLAGDQPLKIIWICGPDQASKMLPELQAQYAGRLEILTTDPEYVEFMAVGVSKAIGLAAVASHYGITQAQTLAFGDGNNDIAMLRWAGTGLAMDHGRAGAIAAADLVAPSGDPETSFARAVEMLFA